MAPRGPAGRGAPSAQPQGTGGARGSHQHPRKGLLCPRGLGQDPPHGADREGLLQTACCGPPRPWRPALRPCPRPGVTWRPPGAMPGVFQDGAGEQGCPPPKRFHALVFFGFSSPIFLLAHVISANPVQLKPFPEKSPFWVNCQDLLLGSEVMLRERQGARRPSGDAFRRAVTRTGPPRPAEGPREAFAWLEPHTRPALPKMSHQEVLDLRKQK